MWLDIYGEFIKLSDTEQLALFEAMKHDLFPEKPEKFAKLLEKIR